MKGEKGGNCNRTACQEPNAIYYNHSTKKYYCKKCADIINEQTEYDSYRMFGHALCILDDDYVPGKVRKLKVGEKGLREAAKMDKWIEELKQNAKEHTERLKIVKHKDGNLRSDDPILHYDIDSGYIISLEDNFTIQQLQALINHMQKYNKEEE